MLLHRIISALIADATITTKDAFHKMKNNIFAKYGDTGGITSIALIEAYRKGIQSGIYPEESRVWKILRKRAVRSLSGVSVISLLTKEWGCPGKCVFCPTYEGLPKSYISDEPAVQRAEMNAFDPLRQIQNRLESLQMTGNAISKCDVRVIGGTWTVYPQSYRDDFIRAIYDAHTLFGKSPHPSPASLCIQNSRASTPFFMDLPKGEETRSPHPSPLPEGEGTRQGSEKISEGFGHPSPPRRGDGGEGLTGDLAGGEGLTGDQRDDKKSPFSKMIPPVDPTLLSPDIETAQQRNESARSRVIGIAIETRPDWIDEAEIRQLREYGVTRVEIGYQTTIDEINAKNIRGHGNAESIRATRLLKDAGFKVVAHMMPGLLGSTPQLDRESMDRVWEDSDFRPDEMKIYPMVVTPHSELEQIWRSGDFTPYDDATLIDLMADLQSTLPEYIRLNRMYRDIPAHEILAGSRLANLRQLTETRMLATGRRRHDISAREIRAKGNNPYTAQLDIMIYEASEGVEIFFQYIDPIDRTIFALLRLRLPSQLFSGEPHHISELDDAVIIRELHVFGDQLQIGQSADGSGQHMGFGKRLLRAAEICTDSLSHQTEMIEIDDLMTEKESLLKDLSTHQARLRRSIHRIAIISGVGVRGYYEHRGYKRNGTYMIREIGEQ